MAETQTNEWRRYEEAMRILDQMRALIREMTKLKSSDRSELDRRIQIAITDMEKVHVWWDGAVVRTLLEEAGG